MSRIDLDQFHLLINRAFVPSYEGSAELRKMTLENLLVRLDEAKEQVKELLKALPSDQKEQSIKHTLDNTQLEQLPDDIEDTAPLTIHGEK